ncbi:hypothetical protein PSRA_1643 [Pseudoscardovia radai]|uniref:Uncharacterized protein n=1 Tax=Pseudoscardovia radai TaxID=987066 RepID=A0A261ERB8_9BIFI|nr:hypothetical protein [Pseudoscardovia radai]OZG49394.1 hypothetical protein PSRA_1643 [Pseudoscardovia radai]
MADNNSHNKRYTSSESPYGGSNSGSGSSRNSSNSGSSDSDSPKKERKALTVLTRELTRGVSFVSLAVMVLALVAGNVIFGQFASSQRQEVESHPATIGQPFGTAVMHNYRGMAIVMSIGVLLAFIVLYLTFMYFEHFVSPMSAMILCFVVGVILVLLIYSFTSNAVGSYVEFHMSSGALWELRMNGVQFDAPHRLNFGLVLVSAVCLLAGSAVAPYKKIKDGEKQEKDPNGWAFFFVEFAGVTASLVCVMLPYLTYMSAV